jgi:dihydrofolate reductase
MRRVRYGVAMSLDGYIAGPKGEADWIVMDPEIDFGAIWSEFDTLLMGRHTFSSMTAMGGGTSGGVRIVVASRTLDQRAYKGATILSDNLRDAVIALKNESGKDIWLFGGGSLFRSLLELDLVDTVEVAVMPVVLGQGIPLLPAPARQTTLKLMSHRIYSKTGIVSLVYDITPAGHSTKPPRGRRTRSTGGEAHGRQRSGLGRRVSRTN